MGIVSDGLKQREEWLDRRLKDLVYERWSLTRRVEEIDTEVDQLEGAKAANDLTRKDVATEGVIAAVKNESEKKEEDR